MAVDEFGGTIVEEENPNVDEFGGILEAPGTQVTAQQAIESKARATSAAEDQAARQALISSSQQGALTRVGNVATFLPKAIAGLGKTAVEGAAGLQNIVDEAQRTPEQYSNAEELAKLGFNPIGTLATGSVKRFFGVPNTPAEKVIGNVSQSGLEGLARIGFDAADLSRRGLNKLKELTPGDVAKGIALGGPIGSYVFGGNKTPTPEELQKATEEARTNKSYEEERKNVAPQIFGEPNQEVSEAVSAFAQPESAAPLIAARIAKAPINALRNSLAKVLQEGAEGSVEQALLAGGGTKKAKTIAGRLAPEILERPEAAPIFKSREGLEELATNKRESAGQAIGDFGKLEGSVNPNEVVDALEKEKEQFIVGGKSIDPDSIDRIQKVQDLFSQYGDNLKTEDLRTIRRAFDADVSKAKGFTQTLPEASLNDIKKQASDKIRNILAREEPDLVPLNKEYSFWKGIEDVVSETNQRLKGKAGGLAADIGTVAGAVTGVSIPNSILRAITFRKLIQAWKSSPGRFAQARFQKGLADAIATNDFKKAAKELREAGFKDKSLDAQIEKAQKLTPPPIPTTPDVLQSTIDNLKSEFPGLDESQIQEVSDMLQKSGQEVTAGGIQSTQTPQALGFD